MASRVASSSLKSGTFAPAITTESRPASTNTERLTPFLALSVGLGPTRSPQNELCPLLHLLPATRSLPLRVSYTPRPKPPRSDLKCPAQPTAGKCDAHHWSHRGTLLASGSTGSPFASGR